MELIAKVSRGSKMDQVYLPRNRQGFPSGSYVIVKPLETIQVHERPYFYGLQEIEPVKLGIVQEIFRVISNFLKEYENIFITGSFLERGFSFNDIDVLIVTHEKINEKGLKDKVESRIKIKIHLIAISSDALLNGLATDPLYQMMLDRAIAKKRFIYHVEREIDYKLLDLHLLKSKSLIDNFDALRGNEKYYLIRNMVAILEFIRKRRINKDSVDREIVKIFRLKDINQIKQNMLNKKGFLKKFKEIYQITFDLIMEGIQYGSKSK